MESENKKMRKEMEPKSENKKAKIKNVGSSKRGWTDEKEREEMTIIFIYYCPCTSLQVFIQDITYTKILTVICACAFVCVCVYPFMLFPIIQGVNGVFESRE